MNILCGVDLLRLARLDFTTLPFDGLITIWFALNSKNKASAVRSLRVIMPDVSKNEHPSHRATRSRHHERRFVHSVLKVFAWIREKSFTCVPIVIEERFFAKRLPRTLTLASSPPLCVVAAAPDRIYPSCPIRMRTPSVVPVMLIKGRRLL